MWPEGSLELPRRQRELLNLVACYAEQNRAATVRDLVRGMCLARESSLNELLLPLQRKGLVSIVGGGRGRDRLIELTQIGRHHGGAARRSLARR